MKPAFHRLLRSLDEVKRTIFVQARPKICIRKSRRGGLFVSVFSMSKKAEEKTRIPILKCKGFWTVINAHGKGKSRDDQVDWPRFERERGRNLPFRTNYFTFRNSGWENSAAAAASRQVNKRASGLRLQIGIGRTKIIRPMSPGAENEMN